MSSNIELAAYWLALLELSIFFNLVRRLDVLSEILPSDFHGKCWDTIIKQSGISYFKTFSNSSLILSFDDVYPRQLKKNC
jgi:hypothetical protein